MLQEPACTLAEISLENVFKDLEKLESAYRDARGDQQKLAWTEEMFNEHLLKHVLPVARTLVNFHHIHCEPKEVCLRDLGDRLLGNRSLYTINLNERHCDDLLMPTILAHELSHAFSAMSNDSLVSLLGWELDANLILAGHECHRVSLYKCLRNMVFHVSYLKARTVGQVDRWKELVDKLYGEVLAQEDVEQNIKHFEQGEEEGFFGDRLSDYSLLPYLCIKGAIKTETTSLIDDYQIGEIQITEYVDISTLLQIWNEVMS